MQNKTIPQQGNNNFTEVVDGRVLKTPNRNGASFLELSYATQVKRWNQYYAGTPYATAFITEDEKLSTPYIEGSGYPNDEQRLAICEDMLKNDFIMVDCRDKRNFVVGKDGKVFPVDFGQFYTSEDKLYRAHLAPVQREINTIKAKLTKPTSTYESLFSPGKAPEHLNAFKDVENYIIELEKYKPTLAKDSKNALAIDKITKIDAFIGDTRVRIAKFNTGDKHAFDDYIESNKASLQVLAQNRTSKALLYSILLSLMVIPAILGVIQLAITKGNAYLYLTDVKGSEKRALDVQKTVIDTKENLSKMKDPDSKGSKLKALGQKRSF